MYLIDCYHHTTHQVVRNIESFLHPVFLTYLPTAVMHLENCHVTSWANLSNVHLYPLVDAVFLLTLGQLFNAMEAFWRGNSAVWFRVDAALLIFYLGFSWSLWTAQVQEVMLFGMFWYLAGKFSLQPNFISVFSAVGSLLEDAMRLLVNTVSFARVGAFCLAHAGLSSALVTLADASNSIFIGVVIMIFANLLIVLLEGLIVSIQTTRLVLFEFFNRFLQAQGRVFKPLPLPPTIIQRRTS